MEQRRTTLDIEEEEEDDKDQESGYGNNNNNNSNNNDYYDNDDMEEYEEDDDDEEEEEMALWSEVVEECCVHTGEEWSWILLGCLLACFFLYFFLFGLELLSTGAKVLTGCRTGELFGSESNPVAGLMVGMLATVLLQSSSTTTSVIVSLTGSAISVQQGIYMIFGANIGTTLTNTIVAMGQMGDCDQLDRAFAGATVHDIFNFMAVIIILPVEVVTGYLDALTGAIVRNAETEKGETWEGPVQKLVSPLTDHVIMENSKVIKAVAAGNATCENGGGFYPIICDAGEPTADSCSRVGLIKCNLDTNSCPIFFDADADAQDDKVSGGVCLFLGLVVLFFCLAGLVAVLQRLLVGLSLRVVHKAISMNGYVAMAAGAGVTILVQSSSIMTSILTPLVGIGAIRLEQMYPLSLGANLGTTVTAILAALVSTGTKALQVAFAHLFFNITGILLFYPVPFMRNIPLNIARMLGKATRVWRGFPLVYIAVMFFVVPLVFLGLSFVFEQGTTGFKVLGALLTLMVGLGFLYTLFYCRYRGGRERCTACLRQREQRREFSEALPDELERLRLEMKVLQDRLDLLSDERELFIERDELPPAAVELAPSVLEGMA